MTTSIPQRFAGLSKVLTVLVVIALVVASVVGLANRKGTKYLTVDFKQVNSLYKGSDVKILGVAVGSIEGLKAKGDIVQVKIAYDSKYKLPNEVKAAIISPSIVGDRFVQLSPAYSGGAVLADNAHLGIERSAVPVELDKIYESLNDLSVALGPQGANKDGSLSRFVDNTAKGLDGQGEQLNETVKNFSKLSQTLADNKDELFGSLGEVQTFVSMLKKNDSSVRAFNDSTAEVSTVLAGERDDLAGTLKALGLALNDVHSFVKENRSAIRGNVDNLTSLSEILAQNEKSLRESILAAPTALSNVAFTYNPKYATLDTRANLLEVLSGGLKDPKTALCGLLGETGTKDTDLCSLLGGLLGGGLPKLPGLSSGTAPKTSTPPVTLPRSAVAGSPQRSERVNDSIQDMLAVN